MTYCSWLGVLTCSLLYIYSLFCSAHASSCTLQHASLLNLLPLAMCLYSLLASPLLILILSTMSCFLSRLLSTSQPFSNASFLLLVVGFYLPLLLNILATNEVVVVAFVRFGGKLTTARDAFGALTWIPFILCACLSLFSSYMCLLHGWEEVWHLVTLYPFPDIGLGVLGRHVL